MVIADAVLLLFLLAGETILGYLGLEQPALCIAGGVTMLLVNAGVGFWQEFKADNAIALLKQRLAPTARVLRDGKWLDLPVRHLVPGDIVLITLGSIIPADVRLIEGEYLSVDQSALTGESLPVDKKTGNAAYSGTIARQVK